VRPLKRCAAPSTPTASYWRYEMEREAAINLNGRKTRQFV
jgi:hypothetical protein